MWKLFIYFFFILWREIKEHQRILDCREQCSDSRSCHHQEDDQTMKMVLMMMFLNCLSLVSFDPSTNPVSYSCLHPIPTFFFCLSNFYYFCFYLFSFWEWEKSVEIDSLYLFTYQLSNEEKNQLIRFSLLLFQSKFNAIFVG